MASFTLTGGFPVGTSVGAYPASNWLTSQLPPSGAPQGAATESQAVSSSGAAAFTALADGTPYYAGAQVGGVWRYVQFYTPGYGAQTGTSGLDSRLTVVESATNAFSSPVALAAFSGGGPALGSDILVPGVLGDRLILFGNADNPTAARRGVFELNPDGTVSTLTTAVNAGTHQFSGGYSWGAAEYKGKLYCGATSGGRPFRLDLNGDGTFNALTAAVPAGTMGNEDTHPGVVAWGYLFIATYGAGDRPGPALYAFDGTSATKVIESSYIGPGGLTNSMAMHNGFLFVTMVDQGTGKNEIYRVRPDLTYDLLYQGPIGWAVTEWRGELLMTHAAAGPGAEIYVLRDGTPVPMTSGANIAGLVPFFAAGDDIYFFNNETGGVSGLRRYRFDGQVTTIPTPANLNGHRHPVQWRGAIHWNVAQTNAGVYKLPLGRDRVQKAVTRQQTQHGGAPGQPSDRIVFKDTTNGRYYAKSFVNGVETVTDLGTQWLNGTIPAPDPAYVTAVLADTPLHYYKMQETSGATATDTGSSPLAGTYVNGPTLNQTGPGSTAGVNKSVLFDGTNDKMEIAAALANGAINNWTIEFWVKLAGTGSQLGTFLTDGGNGGSGVGFTIGIGNGSGGAGTKLQMLINNVAWVDTGYTFANTNWHHVVMQRSAGTLRAYVDKSLQAGTSTTAPAGGTTASNAALGARSAGEYFAGRLAHVASYTSVLSGARINAHYDAMA